MDASTIGLIAFAAVLILLALRVPIAFALASVATIATFFIFAFRTGTFMPERAIRATTSMVFSNSFDLIHSYDLSMIPLFVALGHIAYRADITTKIYHAAKVWLTRLPGGVAMASVMGCGGFSAITGSSIACASTMGKICTPEMLRMGYDPRLATASVAAGGTLGSLIPPSVLFIIYGIFTETSISSLFLAGVLPGLLTLAGFILVIAVWVWRSPEIAPSTATRYSAKERFAAAAETPCVYRSFGDGSLCRSGGGGVYRAEPAHHAHDLEREAAPWLCGPVLGPIRGCRPGDGPFRRGGRGCQFLRTLGIRHDGDPRRHCGRCAAWRLHP